MNFAERKSWTTNPIWRKIDRKWVGGYMRGAVGIEPKDGATDPTVHKV
jgi:hypothetical protein